MKSEQTKRLETTNNASYKTDDDMSKAMQWEQALALSRCADALERLAGCVASCVLRGDGENAIAVFRKDQL